MGIELNVVLYDASLQKLASSFQSGNVYLDRFIKGNESLNDAFGKTYVYLSDDKSKIIGYYNLGVGYIEQLENGKKRINFEYIRGCKKFYSPFVVCASVIGSVNIDDGVIAVGEVILWLHGFDFGTELQLDSVGFQREGHHGIENDVGVGVSSDYAKIVDADFGGDLFSKNHDLGLELGGEFVVGGDGIHVDHGVASQLLLELALQIVDGIVGSEDIYIHGNLGVKGDHLAAGTVIVNDQVMDAGHNVGFHDDALDLLDEFRLGSLTQQRAKGIFGGAVTGKEDQG